MTELLKNLVRALLDNPVLITAGLALFASLIAAAVSIYNASFRRFALERWWDRKAEAYTRIIEALADMVNCYQQILDAELGDKQLSKERRQEINKRREQGYREVVRATNIGLFLISPEAEDYLRQFLEKQKEQKRRARLESLSYDYREWIGDLDQSRKAAKKCLDKLVACAKEDLRVSRWRSIMEWLWRRIAPRRDESDD
jgi:hypothetical protein